MLRTRVRRTTGSTGVSLTVTHGLGQVPDAWWFVHGSNRGVGFTYMPFGTALTNTIDVCNSNQTTVTLDVFCIFYNGRLY